MQMQCLPPDGQPRPEIFWQRNGVELQRTSDANLILAHDGSLIISAARVADSANYTCVARNVAMQRLAPPAELKVYGRYCFTGYILTRVPSQLANPVAGRLSEICWSNTVRRMTSICMAICTMWVIKLRRPRLLYLSLSRIIIR